MRFTKFAPLLSAALLIPACGSDDDSPIAAAPLVSPATAQSVAAGGAMTYTISDLDDTQAYRVTLVVGANVTADGANGTFVDGDNNGAADAGASENIALITMVNGSAIPGVKTYPAGGDDPSNPSGIFPVGGEITVELTGVADGTVYPVAYENGGTTTFLEIDEAGGPIENYGVGGALTVTGNSGTPVISPATPSTMAVNETNEFSITGLNDTQAYRVTLVVANNMTASGNRATFIDGDANGAADAGASENIAHITSVNGVAISGVKTYPAGDDDPANPSGINPSGGKITLEITGIGAGQVYPVAYVNGGTTTFLEVGSDGAPTEIYSVGGSITVQ